jgi:hypothetical protein
MTQTFRRRLGQPKVVVGLMACSMLLSLPPASAQPVFKIDHFKCYITTNPPIDMPVVLQDQFDKQLEIRESVLVRRVVRFCNPVEKVRLDLVPPVVTPIIHPENHLKLYRIFTDDLDLFDCQGSGPAVRAEQEAKG